MEFDSEQRQALRAFREFLAQAGADALPAVGETVEPSAMPESLQTIARLFCLGEAVEGARVPEAVLALEQLELVQRTGDVVTAGGHRLANHLGLFLFCEPVSPSARLYYGQDSLVLSQRLVPAEGRVLDLCAGVGAQALVCARTAASVMAVEMEPLAERVFRINGELNGLGDRVEYLIGDLYSPIAPGRRFDLICANPPFMPVPPGVPFPLFADGGSDGLAVVRRVLAGLPEALAPDGRCHIVGAIPGDAERPDPSSFERSAAEARLGISISCLYAEELDDAMLASCIATAGRDDLKEAFQAHFASLGATRLYYFLLTATHASQPNVYIVHDNVQRVSVSATT